MKNLAAVNLLDKFREVTEYWSPKIIGQVNDQYIKIAKLKGEFVWHEHELEDEMFFIVRGELSIQFESGAVTLRENEFFVVPQGRRHLPVAKEECWVMLIETKTTRHTGKEVTPLTRRIEDQLE